MSRAKYGNPRLRWRKRKSAARSQPASRTPNRQILLPFAWGTAYPGATCTTARIRPGYVF